MQGVCRDMNEPSKEAKQAAAGLSRMISTGQAKTGMPYIPSTEALQAIVQQAIDAATTKLREERDYWHGEAHVYARELEKLREANK